MVEAETPMERFMKLEKIDAPHKWMDNREHPVKFVKFVKDLGDEALKIPSTFVIPYQSATFYELYDFMDKLEFDFKIYPILNKAYWCIEVKK